VGELWIGGWVWIDGWNLDSIENFTCRTRGLGVIYMRCAVFDGIGVGILQNRVYITDACFD
jgi:hypothetical protein